MKSRTDSKRKIVGEATAPLDEFAKALRIIVDSDLSVSQRLDLVRAALTVTSTTPRPLPQTTEGIPADLSIKSLQDRLVQTFGEIDVHDRAGELDALLTRLGVDEKERREQVAAVIFRLIERARNGQSIQPIVRAIRDTEASTLPPIPDVAPKRYIDRPDKKQPIFAFLLDTYGAAISKGLISRPQLKMLDKEAYYAVSAYLKKHRTLPQGIDIPTKTEVIDRMVQTFVPGALVPTIGRTLLRRAYVAKKPPNPRSTK